MTRYNTFADDFKLGVFVAATLILAMTLWPSIRDQKKQENTYVRVICNACGGDGMVTYDADHPLVQLQQAEAGKNYPCPMCGTDGFLFMEQ